MQPFPTTLLPAPAPSTRPASVELAEAWVRGQPARRLMVILRAPGCTYDQRTEGGCTFCGFRHLTTNGIPVSAADSAAQFRAALHSMRSHLPTVREIDIYNSGNFLQDAEMPRAARREILGLCAREPALRLVVVESRPEYITTARLAELRAAVQPREDLAIEIAIGLDAHDDFLRETRLNKGITRPSFERAVRAIGEGRLGLLTYLMLKPWIMSDRDALRDVEAGAAYVHEVAARHSVPARIALEPTFVVPGTGLAREFLSGRYRPPSLWLVRQAASGIAPLGQTTIGLWDENLRPLAVPSSCPACAPRLLAALRDFNRTQCPESLQVEPSCCEH